MQERQQVRHWHGEESGLKRMVSVKTQTTTGNATTTFRKALPRAQNICFAQQSFSETHLFGFL
jgi:hypothetical protein